MVGDRKPFAHVASPWQTSGVCIRVFEYQTPKRNETRAAFFPNFYTRMPFGGTSGDWSRRRCAEWGIFSPIIEGAWSPHTLRADRWHVLRRRWRHIEC